jgi:hypothetical protein
MPGFVKTPKDERKWKEAKEASSKETSPGSKGYWKLSNFIFHKMKKREALEKGMSLKKPMPMPSKVGEQAIVKMPKDKKPASPFAQPSTFFKSEVIKGIKHPSIEKLRIFLESARRKKAMKS